MQQQSITLIDEANNVEIPIQIKINQRARKILLKSSIHNGIELVVPRKSHIPNAIKFARQKMHWIVIQHRNLKSKISIENGSLILLYGKQHQIIHTGKLRGITTIEDNKILLYGDNAMISSKVFTFLKNQAKTDIKQLLDKYSALIGVKYKRSTVKDTTSRWGSCSSDACLSFSFRLIMAPYEVMEYVVIHELCHIKHHDHSRQFWNLVKQYCPEYRAMKHWLKQNSEQLHAVVF